MKIENTKSDSLEALRERVRQSPMTQERLAVALGINPGLLSRILRGLRPAPADFESHVLSILRRYETAEKAAEDARRKAIAAEVDDDGQTRLFD